MRRKKLIECVVIAAVIALFQPVVFGKVYTVKEPVLEKNTVCVAGNKDFYPIEYYNTKTENYEGVMPKILEDVSNRTGIDFAYVHNGETQEELAKNREVDIISSYITDSNSLYVNDQCTIFICSHERKTLKLGWGFTDIASPELISIMKKNAENTSEQEINGYMLLSSSGGRQIDKWFVPFTILYILLLLIVMTYVIFKLKALNKRLYHGNIIDAETNIGNLLYFENCFNGLITEENRNQYYIAYITIDSNYLQTYHGEATFKDSMKYIAGVFKTHIRENEFAARITENGFAFAYKSNDDEIAKKIIDILIDKLNSYIEDSDDEQPYFYVALYRLKTTDTNLELLLFNLRRQCNDIINKGHQLVLCSSSMMDNMAEERKLIDGTVKGLKNDEFKLYLQFIVDNKTKKIVSCEALSRWDNPEMGIIKPSEYISLMEKSGHITMLDYYMFEMCCIQLHKWKDTMLDALTISCNFTRITLSEFDFINKITNIAKRYVFDKNKLIIEITENTIEKNFEIATENICKCKEIGYRIALDDMGTGYTSLLNLCDYPIDIVKIDRDILLKTDTPNGRGLFEGIIALSHNLGLKVICEGVETEQQKELVDTTDCDYVQGWYYSHVFPAREGEDFAKKQI